MDAFVLLFTLAILLALGMPVAFAVGLRRGRRAVD